MSEQKFYKRISILIITGIIMYLAIAFTQRGLLKAAPVSFGNDSVVTVSTIMELFHAIENDSEKIVFANDIVANTHVQMIIKAKKIEIDGAGYSLDLRTSTNSGFVLSASPSDKNVPNLVLKNMTLKKTDNYSTPFVTTTVSGFVYVQFQGNIKFDPMSNSQYAVLPYGKVEFLDADVLGHAPFTNYKRTAIEAKDFSFKNTTMTIDQDRFTDSLIEAVFATRVSEKATFVFDKSNITLKNNNSVSNLSKFSLVHTTGAVDFVVKNGSILKLSGKAPPLFFSDSPTTGSRISIESHSIVELTGTNSLIKMDSSNSILTVDNASLLLKGNANREEPLVWFSSNSNGAQIEVKNSGMIHSMNASKDKLGVSANVFNFSGTFNFFSVKSGGKLFLDNRLYSNPPASGSNSSNYAAIYFESGINNFTILDASDPITVEGKRTEVNINSDYAAGIASGGDLYIKQGSNTVTKLKGSSLNAEGDGVIVTNGKLNMIIDRPYLYDYMNIRKDGGAIFGVNDGSKFTLLGSAFSVWRYQDNVLSAPSFYYRGGGTLEYIDRDLGKMGSNMDIGFGKKLPFLNRGMAKRISGQNLAPILTGIRTPTNADKRVIISVSSPEDSLSENSVYAKLKITGVDGSVKTMISGVKGFDPSTGIGGVKTWEEKVPQGSRIEFLLDSYLKAADEIEVVDIWKNTNDPANPAALHGNLSSVVTKQKVVDVVPPELIYLDSNLAVGQTSLRVGANSKNHSGDHVELYLNSHYVGTTTIKADGSFLLDFEQQLRANDTVQLSMRDNSSSVVDATSTLNSKFQRPITNNDIGNGNPIEGDYTYHDQKFVQAVKYIVKDSSPPSADPKVTSVRLGDSQSIIEGELKNFLTNIKDDLSSVDKITAKLTAGQDIEKLVSTIGLKDLYIDLTDEAGNTATIKTQIKVYENTLIVEFVTADHETLCPPVKIKKANPIDLTKENAVVEAIAKITAQNYQLYERPADETQIVVPAENDLTVSYKFDGSLNLISAPKTFDFGTQSVSIESVKYKNPHLVGEPLIVSDTRANKVTWQLKAKLDQPLTSLEDKNIILPETIKYNYQEKELTLTTENVIILSHLNKVSGNYNVTTEQWTNGDGFVVHSPVGMVKSLGKYQAKITITLENAK